MAQRNLTNADLVVLLLIAEHQEATGYLMTRVVEERGYRAWAGVGVTSVYNRLKILQDRKLISSRPDVAKQTRGPTGRVYRLTSAGRRRLIQEVRTALAGTREHDPRFNIALSGVELLTSEDAVACLTARIAFLDSETERLEELAANSPGAGNLSRDLLFERSLHAINAERTWVNKAKQRIAAAMEGVSP